MQLGLAGELGLGHVGHADHVAAPLPVERRFRPASRIAAPPSRGRCRPRARSRRPRRRLRRRPRASDVQTGSATETCATSPAPKNDFSRAKVRSMNWSTITKCPGAISSRNDPTAETETRCVTPAAFSRRDVGAVGHGRGRVDVAPAVARQEHHPRAAQRTVQQRVRRRPPRRVGGAPLRVLQPVDVVEARAADDADHRLHGDPFMRVDRRLAARRRVASALRRHSPRPDRASCRVTPPAPVARGSLLLGARNIPPIRERTP